MSEWERALYNIRLTSDNMYRVVKFDGWYNVLGINYVWKNVRLYCSCPQSHMPGCRHRVMLYVFRNVNRVDTGWLYDYDNLVWERPINDPVRLMMQKAERARGKAT